MSEGFIGLWDKVNWEEVLIIVGTTQVGTLDSIKNIINIHIYDEHEIRSFESTNSRQRLNHWRNWGGEEWLPVEILLKLDYE